MRCPTCPDAQLVITDRQGVEIDYCPECRGVWLDRGELDKIIERSMEGPGRGGGRDMPRYSAPERRSRDRYDDDHDHRRGRRKKSSAAEFLSEIFDFD